MKTKFICAALLFCMMLTLVGCGGANDNTTSESTTIGFYTTDEDCFVIKTKYADLEYPEKWEKSVKTEIVETAPYTVKFYAITKTADIPLFNISFGSGKGFLLGTLPTANEKIPVYLDSFSFDEKSMSKKEYENCCAMEEDVNVIISRLIEKNGLVLNDNNNSAPEMTESDKTFDIKTKYGTLKFPEKWQKIAEIKIDDGDVYTVKFSCKTINAVLPVFDLTFNGGDGYELGKMKINGETVTVYITDYPINEDALSDDDYFNCCAVQEDVNVIMQHLAEDYGFEY